RTIEVKRRIPEQTPEQVDRAPTCNFDPMAIVSISAICAVDPIEPKDDNRDNFALRKFLFSTPGTEALNDLSQKYLREVAMRVLALQKTGFAALLTASLAVPEFAAAQTATTDIGTLDQETAEKAFPAKPPYSPYAGRNFPTRPFFGDTHLHTSFSMDAGAFGARLGPKDAYRFAKGEEVVASSGQRAKLSRPLDFLVVSDHSDGMGFFPQLMSADPVLMATPQGRKWYDEINSGKGAQAAV